VLFFTEAAAGPGRRRRPPLSTSREGPEDAPAHILEKPAQWGLWGTSPRRRGGAPAHRVRDYRAEGGYQQLARARQMEPPQVIKELRPNLRDAAARSSPPPQASFIRADPEPTYLTVNADESEPAPPRTRDNLRVPHRLIEGCLLTRTRSPRKKRLHLPSAARSQRVRDHPRRLDEGTRPTSSRRHDRRHRGAGAYICGRRPACSSRSRASAPDAYRSKTAVRTGDSGLYASPR